MEEYISRAYWRGRSGRGWLGLTGHGGAGEDGSHAVEQIRSRGSRDLGRGDVGQEGSIGRTVARRRELSLGWRTGRRRECLWRQDESERVESDIKRR